VPEYRSVCQESELAPGQARLVEIEGRAIGLFNVRGRFHAMVDTCLHAGGPLHEGELKGKTVLCPWHAWAYDVTTGRCDMNPMVTLDCFPVRVREGVVEIEV